jgi:PAS domain S-box-containing protein
VQEALRASEVRYRRLFETAQDGILLLDANTGQITDVNAFLIKMLGYSYEEFVGRKIWEIGLLKDIAASKTAFRELQSKEYVRYEHLPLETKGGDEIEVEFVSNVYRVDHKKVIQCNIRDITARKRAERELAKVKADFAGMIVHDLRSPLTNVMGAATILEEGLVGPVTEEQKKFLAKIGAASRSLLDLISDFLDLSKIEAGRIELVKEEVDLEQLIQNSLDNYLIVAQRKKISLKTCAAPGHARVCADPRRLDQVFGNLLSNAIKFTREGGEIEVGASQENLTEVKLWVKDDGVGISPQEIGNLFEKYRQTTSGKNSTQKGTGLGLVICKMIVEAHEGRIWVESEERKGTTFFFSLPI